MMRRFHSDRSTADFGSSMTPMIDVVFLLLVFFVWTYSSQAVELLLPSRLSNPQGSQPQVPTAPQPEDDFDQLVIRIEWTGEQPRWKINEAELASIAELQSRLRTIHEIFAETRVIIDPAANVPIGHVIEVFDTTRLVGFGKVALAAQRDSALQD